jgi:hypothetical protein
MTEPDRVPVSPIFAALAIAFVAIAISAGIVWQLAGRGGGVSAVTQPAIEPPADPFSVTTRHEAHRAAQRRALDAWIDRAIDRYVEAHR